MGSELQITTFTLSRQAVPNVDVASSGGFVVVWNAYATLDDLVYSIHGRRIRIVLRDLG